MARLLRGYAHAALEDQPLWHERDISHSSAERVLLPDATILLDYMLVKMTGLIEGLVVHPERMRENIERGLGLHASSRVLLTLVERGGLSREEAYAIVQRAALRAADERIPLQGVLATDPIVAQKLSLADLDAAFDDAFDLPFEAVSLATIVNVLGARARTQIVILDSCRSNPFAGASVLADITLDNVPLGNGTFSIKITDLDRKVNVNTAGPEALEQAFRLVGIDAGEFTTLSSSIQDWIDPDESTHIDGAESDFYQGLPTPYFSKNAPIDDLSELLLIKGITPDIYWGGVATNHTPTKFQPKFGSSYDFSSLNAGDTVYPVGLHELLTPFSSGRININTASAIQLQMIPGVDENVAQQIIQLRAGPDGADSSRIVTGPSFTSATSMWVPNRPVRVGTPAARSVSIAPSQRTPVTDWFH